MRQSDEMSFVRFALFSAISISVAVPFASAATINVSTGQNASGVVQSTGGALDANWIYNDSFINAGVPNGYPTTGQAQVDAPGDNDYYSGWVANNSSSAWIAPDVNVFNNGNAPYTFTDTFSLTSGQLSSAALSGTWAIDDGGTLSLNGHVISTLTSGNFYSLNSFSAPTADFVSGANTLTITMTSSDNYVEAVRLAGAVTTAGTVPEPSSLLMMGMAGLSLAAAAYRKAKA